MTRQNEVSVKCVENMLVIGRNRECIILENMQVHRALSVCSVEKILAARIVEGGIRKICKRRKIRKN